MRRTPEEMICELRLLKNRLEAGESLLQCLQSMGIPLRAHRSFLDEWDRLARRMLEGTLLPAKAVAEFAAKLEDANRLINLAQQKTLSARLQAALSLAIALALILFSHFLFPAEVRASPLILGASLGLCVLSAATMQLLLKYFARDLCFLEWIFFLRSLALSLQCGRSLGAALEECRPPAASLNLWPKELRVQLSLSFLESELRPKASASQPLWKIASRVWESIARNYREGLSQVELINRLCQLQEDEFRNRMIQRSEYLNYLLLLPLFGLSVPAVLLILFAPLLEAFVSGPGF